MAVLTAQAESSNGFEITEVAPSGEYVATCLDVADDFGVTRRKYQSEETEQIDVTRFLFGFKAQDGRLYKVQTFEMKISSSPKSSLIKFLTSWLGKPPAMGWDYCELKGKGCVMGVEQVMSQLGKQYNKISKISPPKTSLADYTAQVIAIEQFNTPPVAPATPLPSAPAPFDPAPVTNYDDNAPF